MSASAVAQLEELGGEMLRSNRITYQQLAAFATPRRLALYVWGVGEQQADLVEEVKGPSRKAAFDEQGQPTRAAEGFARGQGVSVADLVVRPLPAASMCLPRSALPAGEAKQVLERAGSPVDQQPVLPQADALGRPGDQVCPPDPLAGVPVGQGGGRFRVSTCCIPGASPMGFATSPGDRCPSTGPRIIL